MIAHKAKNFAASALNLLFPPQCLGCKTLVEQDGALCQACWGEMVFIAEPVCERCGFPFDYALGEGALCAECLSEPPLYTQARAVLRYDEHSHRLVLPLKFFDQTHAVPTYTQWMLRAAHPFLERCELVVPVPLHWRRLWQRKYNQSALLGASIAHSAGLPFIPDALIRTRYTTPQTGLTRKERLVNLKKVFAPNPKTLAEIQSKNVLLIDDVTTTGATLNACCAALHEARVRDIYVLTLAKTIRGA